MSSHLEATLATVIAHLSSTGSRFALIGGLAVSARAEPRFTRDIDLAVAVDSDRAAEDLVRELRTRGYEVLAIVEQESARRLATVRLSQNSELPEGVVVDLLFASSGVEREIAAAAEEVEIFPGIKLPVAQPGHLLALKILSRAKARPQDDIDLAALLKAASAADIETAFDTLALITARGFHRGRDLAADFARAREGHGAT